MGKAKQKGRKRKVKNPYRLQSQKLAKIAHKIDRKPADDQTQEIPWRIRRIADFEQKMKTKHPRPVGEEIQKQKGKKNTKKDSQLPLIDTAVFVEKHHMQPGMQRQLPLLPHLKQLENETDETFLRRVNIATQTMLKEAEFEDRYNVEVTRNNQGKVKMVKRRNALDDPTLSEKQRAKLEEREKMRKEKKKQRDWKRKHKNQKGNKEVDEFSQFQDKVQFGEVVYEPPSLDTSKISKLTGGETKTKSFLFMEKLQDAQAKKMPELTTARKRTLEDERLKAVQAYRDMKAAKYKSNKKNLQFG